VTRTVRGERSRERLLQVATELIAAHGVAGTSVSQICERAGVAKTALYHHFDHKEGLLAAVLERVGTRWIEELRKSAYEVGDPLLRLDRLVEDWHELLLREPELVRLPLVVQLELGDSPKIRAALAHVRERAERDLAQGIEDSLGPVDDVAGVAETALTLLGGAAIRQRMDPQLDLRRILDELKRTLIAVLVDRLGIEEAERRFPAGGRRSES